MPSQLKDALIPGYRILKTSLAVFLCLSFFQLIGYENPIYAAIACVLTMRSSMQETSQYGFDRIIGTILGGVVSIIILLLPLEAVYRPLPLTLAILLSMTIAKVFNFRSPVFSMSAVVILITLISHSQSSEHAFNYVVIRVLETLVGILIALVINRLVRPDELKKKQ